MKTMQQDQHIISVFCDAIIPENKNAQPFLKEHERIAFDLQCRTLVFATGDFTTGIARFSPIEAHLLLALLVFYPYYASDATLAIGYTTNLFTYYQYLEGEAETRHLEALYPIADGIDRLKKKVIPLGMTIVRVRNTGYILERGPSPAANRRAHTYPTMQACKR